MGRKTKLTRGEQRRKRIFRSLHDCIIKKGYSKTTLAEIAESADMSPSHLLYYFKGKDAILEDYFQNVALQILERMSSFREHSPQVQIDELAKLFFAGAGITKSEIGFMLECFGVAVNDKRSAGIDADALPRNERDHAWFVGYAPAEQPAIAFAVVVEHGGHGGTSAAPIARRVLEIFFSEPGTDESQDKAARTTGAGDDARTQSAG